MLEIPLAEGTTRASCPAVRQQIRLSSSLFASPDVLADLVWTRCVEKTFMVGVRFRDILPADQERIEEHLRDRRNALRQQADFSASVQSLEEASSAVCPALVENISITGALITLPEPDTPSFAPGSRVRFTCQYLFMDTFTCTGVVAWHHQDRDVTQLGLFFEDLDAQHRKLIERFVG
jgi:c-di-GMP-binding flagellar brake protein YcgR